MPEPAWRIESIANSHETDRFDCSNPSLNDFLQKYAGQNERAGLSRTFVAVEPDNNVVLGYYSLSAGSVKTESLTEAQRKRLPRYPVPVAHLGRLARDNTVKGQGMGPFLLIDAMRRILLTADEIGVHAIEVIAIDDRARHFYETYRFESLIDDKNHLYIPLKTVRKLDLI